MKTILIAEDEIVNFLYLNEVLKSSGMKILHAFNGREAIELCRNNEDIDLILMDIKMPLMDGSTAATLIKEFRPDLPIIAQTASALKTEKHSFSEAFDDYLTKPIKKDLLKQKLQIYFTTVG